MLRNSNNEAVDRREREAYNSETLPCNIHWIETRMNNETAYYRSFGSEEAPDIGIYCAQHRECLWQLERLSRSAERKRL